MTYRLICFDVDGTLIDEHKGRAYWGTLHRLLEGEQEGEHLNDSRKALFKAGKISYEEWVALDLDGFRRRGATKDDFVRAALLHSLAPGARETVLELKRRGCKLAVISGSLSIFLETLFPGHPFDDVYTNRVVFGSDGLIERWETTVYDEGSKHKAMHEICKRERIPLSQAVFVGDGENDIDILKEAGLGIAFCPKSERVVAAADVVIRKKDVREILKYLE